MRVTLKAPFYEASVVNTPRSVGYIGLQSLLLSLVVDNSPWSGPGWPTQRASYHHRASVAKPLLARVGIRDDIHACPQGLRISLRPFKPHPSAAIRQPAVRLDTASICRVYRSERGQRLFHLVGGRIPRTLGSTRRRPLPDLASEPPLPVSPLRPRSATGPPEAAVPARQSQYAAGVCLPWRSAVETTG